MQLFSLHKTRGSFLALLILLLPLFTFAQVTCPADFSVCGNAPSFELTGATPSGGTYSGKGVSSGTFSPMEAGTGTHLITYSYTEGSETRTCSFNIEVKEEPRVTCILVVPDPFCLNGKPMRPERTCLGPQGSTNVLTGPGITDNIFYPASVGVGVHKYTMTVTGVNGCVTIWPGSVEVIEGTPPVVTCPENMTIASSTDPPVTLTASNSGGENAVSSYWGKGVNDDMFDPGVAGEGSHNVLYESYISGADYDQCRNFCSFKITVGALPVTLTDFKAVNSESNIILNWETAMEKGFDRFEIERSLNPKSGFKKIQEIKGSASPNNYSYVDSNVEKGMPTYYRLRMVDLDGSFAYSTIVWALVEGAEKVSVFPNPASTQLTVESPIEMLEIKLMNAVGNQLFTEPGSYKRSRQISLPALPAGIYLLQVKDVRGVSRFSRVVLR